MNMSRLRKQLKIDEGVKYEVYLDSLGLKTCGIGHLIRKGNKEYNLPVGAPISEERVEELFKKDIEIVIEDCHEVFGWFDHFGDQLQEVIANMMFNLGINRFRGFKKFIQAIHVKDFKKASIEMEDSKWFRQVGNRAKRLQQRILEL